MGKIIRKTPQMHLVSVCLTEREAVGASRLGRVSCSDVTIYYLHFQRKCWTAFEQVVKKL